MKKGLFITFEGAEGAGKTTQIKMLAEYFKRKGEEVVTTREPGGTELAEKLRGIVKYYSGAEPMCDQTEVFLFAASRAQHVQQLIRPAVDSGRIVICDRFYDSTLAYQGYARGQDMKFLRDTVNYAVAGCIPDITFLLDISPEAGFQRVNSRNDSQSKDDRIEKAGLEFHTKVRNGFLELAEKEPERIKVIDAALSPEEIHKQIVEIIENAVI